ncbi:hypothetical protein K488DRAFT_91864 [Vararia minispora EC-137]|uniref:Uncharacterized protein n=1 Tax=Vararia minispora EC-137 TaxID=1314806 RepID=A0ACB8Q548_9AGAM|nr:hypothetical protein K488DRAFT_91864 [Vararia minispora EC-137]
MPTSPKDVRWLKPAAQPSVADALAYALAENRRLQCVIRRQHDSLVAQGQQIAVIGRNRDVIVAQRDHAQRAQSARLTISAEHEESTLPPPYDGFGATPHHIAAIPDAHRRALDAVRDTHQRELDHMRDAHRRQLANISAEHQCYFSDVVRKQEHDVAAHEDAHRRELANIAEAHELDTAERDEIERLREGLVRAYRYAGDGSSATPAVTSGAQAGASAVALGGRRVH